MELPEFKIGDQVLVVRGGKIRAFIITGLTLVQSSKEFRYESETEREVNYFSSRDVIAIVDEEDWKQL